MTSVLAASPVMAASDLDFYENLLRRGVAHFAEGNLPVAVSELHIAAFGLLEKIDEYETAYVYLTIAAGRLHNEADVRTFVLRLLAAERVEARYAALPIPGSLRQEFEALAASVLTPAQLGVLHGPASAKPLPARPLPLPVPVPVPAAPVPAPVTPEPVPERPTVVITPSPRPVISSRESKPVATPPAAPPASTVPSTSTRNEIHIPFPATEPEPKVTRPATRPLPPTPVPAPVTAPSQTTPRAQPATAAPAAAPALAMAASDVRKAIVDGQRALDDGDLGRVRELYRPLLEVSSLPHDAALQVGEGLYRTHDYASAVRAFQRAGAFSRSEAQQQYAYAVSLYEIGRYGDAKRQLALALPSLDMTPEVARYRTRIEGAIE